MAKSQYNQSKMFVNDGEDCEEIELHSPVADLEKFDLNVVMQAEEEWEEAAEKEAYKRERRNARLALGRTATKKTNWVIVPFLISSSFLCYVDRANIAYAALTMNEDLQFSDSTFGFAAGLFFLSYAVLGVPVTLLARRTGEVHGMTLLLVCWGFTSLAQGFVNTAGQLYTTRVLLGAAEAGFYPIMLCYMKLWFSKRDAGLIYAMITTSTALSGVVGGPLAVGLMTMFDGVLGAAGWRWLFIVQGALTVFWGVLMEWFLPEKPSTGAYFLSESEAKWLANRLEREVTSKADSGTMAVKATLTSPTVWKLGVVLFTWGCGFYGILFWMPIMIQSVSEGRGIIWVGFSSALPYLSAAVSMVLVARLSDALNERKVHVAMCLGIGGAGLAVSSLVDYCLGSGYEWTHLASLSVAASGIWSLHGPFWAIAFSILSGDAAALGFPLINTIGIIGGVVGPQLTGILKEISGQFVVAMLGETLVLAIGALVALTLSHPELG